jgi:hypothetical protein
MSELGPFFPKKDGTSLTPNPYAWNQLANMLWLESPAFVGFSTSNDTRDAIVGEQQEGWGQGREGVGCEVVGGWVGVSECRGDREGRREREGVRRGQGRQREERALRKKDMHVSGCLLNEHHLYIHVAHMHLSSRGL